MATDAIRQPNRSGYPDMTNKKRGEDQAAKFPRLRDAVQTVANAALTVDYISILESEPHAAAPGLTIKYVPDKLILTSQSFDDYITEFRSVTFDSLEEFAIAVLSDINNEVVPRWCQIVVWRRVDGITNRCVVVEDRQPNWDNPALLSRIAPV